MASANSTRSPKPSWDVVWVNNPVLFNQGPFANQWIRTEIKVEQHPQVGKKYAARERSDARSIGPPIFVSQRIYLVHQPVQYDHNGRLVIPPPGCPETLVDPIEDAHAQHWICISSLYAIYPPTRESNAGRVGSLPMDPSGHRPKADTNPNYTAINGSIAGTRKIPWTPARPYPLTALPATSENWSSAVSEAKALCIRFDPSTEAILGRRPPKNGEDLDDEQMALLEKYLPREEPAFIDINANMIAQYGSGVREVDAKILENAPPEIASGPSKRWMVYVFDDLLLIQEGYWVLRFHVVNLHWTLHPGMFTVMSRPNVSTAFSVLADCFSNPMAVYSSKEYPGLPPTSELTKHVAGQLKIRHRENQRPSNHEPTPPRSLKPNKKRRSQSGSSIDSTTSHTRDKVTSLREIAPEPNSKIGEALINAAEAASGSGPRETAKTELWDPQSAMALAFSNQFKPSTQLLSDSPVSGTRFMPYPTSGLPLQVQKLEHSPGRRHRVGAPGLEKSPLTNSMMFSGSSGPYGPVSEERMMGGLVLQGSRQTQAIPSGDSRATRSYSMTTVPTASPPTAPTLFRSASHDHTMQSPALMATMPPLHQHHAHPAAMGVIYSQPMYAYTPSVQTSTYGYQSTPPFASSFGSSPPGSTPAASTTSSAPPTAVTIGMSPPTMHTNTTVGLTPSSTLFGQPNPYVQAYQSQPQGQFHHIQNNSEVATYTEHATEHYE